jgi:translation initiation factor 3 subunit E
MVLLAMATYDLTNRIVPFFDLHLVIPLLEFVGPRKVYNEESLVETHRKLLLKTNMIDSVIETYPDNQVPQDLLKRRDEVLQERDQLKTACDPVIEILENDDVKEMMDSARDREGNSKLFEYIEQKYEFKIEMIDSLYKYAKFQYECGNYSAASICLYYYRMLVPQQDPNYLSALYGKLASEILCQEWTHAKDDLSKLRAYIDSDPFDTELELLQHRAWLLHWALFVYFNYPKGRDEVIEMFLNQQPYLNTIQILCPHLLRYLAVAVVTSKTKQKNSLKDLIKVIDVERHNYQDPVTDFLSCLYINFDFDEAQQKLRECEAVLTNDFFLTACLDDFRESARLLIFEMFCRIHQCISLEMLANRLNMAQAEAERWIVDLIRNYRIEGAKIDSQTGQVVMGAKPVSIHEQVMENTKRLTFRSQQVALQLEKLKLDKKVNYSFILFSEI